MPNRLISRTYRHQGRKITVRLEADFWSALEHICTHQGQSLGEMLAQERGPNRTRSIRVFALRFYRDAAEAAGRREAGSVLPAV